MNSNLVTSAAAGAGTLRITRHASRITHRAFSLIEILVVIGLLSVIILGLLAMFNQTKRAFTTGMTQVDVLEAGRAATGMMGRDLSQMTPVKYTRDAVTFYAQLPAAVQPLVQYLPLLQPLPGTNSLPERRTNVLEELFFLTHQNQDGEPRWSGIGYWVGNPTNGNPTTPIQEGWGALYRFQSNSVFGASPSPEYLYNRYSLFAARQQRMNRIIDGVVHFKVRAYDTNGVWITPPLPPQLFRTNMENVWSGAVPGEIGLYRFTNNAVPAFVEFELGVLEERVLARVKSIPDAPTRKKYLEAQAGRVHLFRMRVPVHNVDPTAYQ